MTKSYNFPKTGSVISLTSENIDKMYYFDEDEVLLVKFIEGGTYQYEHVNMDTYLAVVDGATSKVGKEHSVGSAFYQFVRSYPHVFPYRKIDEQ